MKNNFKKPCLKNAFKAYLKDTRGATAIEYGMIITGISITIMAIIFTLGDTLTALFQMISDRIMSVL